LPAVNYPSNRNPPDIAIGNLNADVAPDLAPACGERAMVLSAVPGVPGAFSPAMTVG
jgi:hypothetical protein